MADNQPLRLALVWHMHQPNYGEPGTNDLALPWVRFHALKDYLDMLLAVLPHERARVTFNLVPSLLDQFDLYVQGGSDTYLDLSRLDAANLTSDQKSTILDCFFDANEKHLIGPHERYHELYRKARGSQGQAVRPSLFTSEEMCDLQVWANLAWVDPMFHTEEPVRTLLAKGRHFSENEKHALLEWQREFIGRIVPAYREAFAGEQIDISFTPYYHPILPLLCDTDVAREALPKIVLPKHRFAHPEDAEWHLRAAMDKFESVFGQPLEGIWPSEGSVSEEVATMVRRLGLKWMASDEEVLYHSLRKSGLDVNDNPVHAVYDHGPGLKILFRDHALSDRIGFVYSGWEADRAAADFVEHLLGIRKLLVDRLDEVVVPVILDGENAWEHFDGDGSEFLSELYGRLSRSSDIEMVTMKEAIRIPSRPLPALHAGSWINHNFRIWIGHQEDNVAWDLLSEARRTLVEFGEQNPDFPSDKMAQAWRQIYVAEGSDWCWWYGDEHRGTNNKQFDRIYRQHLIAVYEIVGLDPPASFRQAIYRGSLGVMAVPPDTLLTPVIDGFLTHFYEWSGAGYYDCLKADAAMHRVTRIVSRVHFAYDHDHVYIRLDMADSNFIDSSKSPEVRIVMTTPEDREIVMALPGDGTVPGEGYRYASGNCVECAIDREHLWPAGFGTLEFKIMIQDGCNTLEVWPESDVISLVVAEKNRELFWPT